MSLKTSVKHSKSETAMSRETDPPPLNDYIYCLYITNCISTVIYFIVSLVGLGVTLCS